MRLMATTVVVFVCASTVWCGADHHSPTKRCAERIAGWSLVVCVASALGCIWTVA